MISRTRISHTAMCVVVAMHVCFLNHLISISLSFRVHACVCVCVSFISASIQNQLYTFIVIFTTLRLCFTAGSPLVLLLLFKQLYSYFYTFFLLVAWDASAFCVVHEKFIQSVIVCWFRFVDFFANDFFVFLFPLLRLPGVGHLVRLHNKIKITLNLNKMLRLFFASTLETHHRFKFIISFFNGRASWEQANFHPIKSNDCSVSVV